jgi:protein SCO1/2
MERKQRNLLILGALSCALGIFAILGVLQTNTYIQTAGTSHEVDNSQAGQVPIGGAFQLVDKDGKSWQDKDFRGRPMLVYFGYSYCPDICPAALTHLTEAVEMLGGGKVVQPVFISLDPERDTPENLRSFAENFHKDFVMLTGSRPQVEQAVQAYKVHAARTTEDRDNYQVDHSSLIYLMDKDGKYVAHFDHQTPSEEIVKGVEKFIRH